MPGSTTKILQRYYMSCVCDPKSAHTNIMFYTYFFMDALHSKKEKSKQIIYTTAYEMTNSFHDMNEI